MNDFKDQMFWGIIFIMVFAFLFVPLPRLHGDDNEDGSDDE